VARPERPAQLPPVPLPLPWRRARPDRLLGRADRADHLGGDLPPSLRGPGAVAAGPRRQAAGPLRQRPALPPGLRRARRLRPEDPPPGLGAGGAERWPGPPPRRLLAVGRGVRGARLPPAEGRR